MGYETVSWEQSGGVGRPTLNRPESLNAWNAELGRELKAVGKARAFQMALLGERVPAPQALEWGLVNWVHPDGRLLEEANALVERLAAGPTRSYAGSKQALTRFIYGDLDGQLELEAELQHSLGRTKDFMEGVAAFVEKRAPAFTGS